MATAWTLGAELASGWPGATGSCCFSFTSAVSPADRQSVADLMAARLLAMRDEETRRGGTEPLSIEWQMGIGQGHFKERKI